ncbi:hypothetical protein PGSY75_1244400 [Plasmodium gaboni]|uniref:RNA-binding protein n=1 Tax=Plasmodium gaboni TaxID=647221 RepID=A0A151LGW8_9APIC|nr:hypothetical protein PGSY75_1244400 [Plasmodium gaboni]KYN98225.1 hypothetical protein PGSY75_1244400 [Plasmodium gaboni]
MKIIILQLFVKISLFLFFFVHKNFIYTYKIHGGFLKYDNYNKRGILLRSSFEEEEEKNVYGSDIMLRKSDTVEKNKRKIRYSFSPIKTNTLMNIKKKIALNERNNNSVKNKKYNFTRSAIGGGKKKIRTNQKNDIHKSLIDDINKERLKEKIYSIKNMDNDNNDMKIRDDDNVNILPLPVEKNGEGYNCLILCKGLPFHVDNSQIIEFFKPYKIIEKYIIFMRDKKGHFFGDILVRFINKEQKYLALKNKNFKFLLHRYIQLYHVNEEHYEEYYNIGYKNPPAYKNYIPIKNIILPNTIEDNTSHAFNDTDITYNYNENNHNYHFGDDHIHSFNYNQDDDEETKELRDKVNVNGIMLKNLYTGRKLKGRITSVHSYGAFLDCDVYIKNEDNRYKKILALLHKNKLTLNVGLSTDTSSEKENKELILQKNMNIIVYVDKIIKRELPPSTYKIKNEMINHKLNKNEYNNKHNNDINTTNCSTEKDNNFIFFNLTLDSSITEEKINWLQNLKLKKDSINQKILLNNEKVKQENKKDMNKTKNNYDNKMNNNDNNDNTIINNNNIIRKNRVSKVFLMNNKMCNNHCINEKKKKNYFYNNTYKEKCSYGKNFNMIFENENVERANINKKEDENIEEMKKIKKEKKKKKKKEKKLEQSKLNDNSMESDEAFDKFDEFSEFDDLFDNNINDEDDNNIANDESIIDTVGHINENINNINNNNNNDNNNNDDNYYRDEMNCILKNIYSHKETNDNKKKSSSDTKEIKSMKNSDSNKMKKYIQTSHNNDDKSEHYDDSDDKSEHYDDSDDKSEHYDDSDDKSEHYDDSDDKSEHYDDSDDKSEPYDNGKNSPSEFEKCKSFERLSDREKWKSDIRREESLYYTKLFKCNEDINDYYSTDNKKERIDDNSSDEDNSEMDEMVNDNMMFNAKLNESNNELNYKLNDNENNFNNNNSCDFSSFTDMSIDELKEEIYKRKYLLPIDVTHDNLKSRLIQICICEKNKLKFDNFPVIRYYLYDVHFTIEEIKMIILTNKKFLNKTNINKSFLDSLNINELKYLLHKSMENFRLWEPEDNIKRKILNMNKDLLLKQNLNNTDNIDERNLLILWNDFKDFMLNFIYTIDESSDPLEDIRNINMDTIQSTRLKNDNTYNNNDNSCNSNLYHNNFIYRMKKLEKENFFLKHNQPLNNQIQNQLNTKNHENKDAFENAWLKLNEINKENEQDLPQKIDVKKAMAILNDRSLLKKMKKSIDDVSDEYGNKNYINKVIRSILKHKNYFNEELNEEKLKNMSYDQLLILLDKLPLEIIEELL